MAAWFDELADWVAGLPVCRWCGQNVYVGKTHEAWHHQDTGSRVCAGQVVGLWSDLHKAEPTIWKDAE